MKFEQAFYTRAYRGITDKDGEEGLRIVAASRQDKMFLNDCLSIGGRFYTESECVDKTAEFVIYAKEFGAFVGVGISPAPGTDKVGGNKLCHIFVPVQHMDTKENAPRPEEYYLKYPFQKSYRQTGTLAPVQVTPYLNHDSYKKILHQYEFDQGKLAEFLYKLYPVMLNKRNLLLILLDRSLYQEAEHAQIARDITWLASCLVPGVGKEAAEYQKRLSYGVYTKENISVVNLAYSADQALYDYYFALGRKPEEEAPEFFQILAQMALQSKQCFQTFVKEILEHHKKSRVSMSDFNELYFFWKLDHKKPVKQEECPITMEQMVEHATNSIQEWKVLINYILSVDNLGKNEMVMAWKYIIAPENGDIIKESQEISAIIRLITLAYDNSRHNYKLFVERIPTSIRSQVLNDLYVKKDSCIKKHLEEISNIPDFLQVEELYHGLSDQGYSLKLQTIVEQKLKGEIPETIRNRFTAYLKKRNAMSLDYRKNVEKKLWETNAKGDLTSKLFCSLMLGVRTYSIWESIPLCDVGQYESIYAKIQQNPAYAPIEDEAVAGKAEVNRNCYCLWKQVVKYKDCRLDVFAGCNTAPYQKDITEFIETLKRGQVDTPDMESIRQLEKLPQKKPEGGHSFLRTNGQADKPLQEKPQTGKGCMAECEGGSSYKECLDAIEKLRGAGCALKQVAQRDGMWNAFTTQQRQMLRQKYLDAAAVVKEVSDGLFAGNDGRYEKKTSGYGELYLYSTDSTGGDRVDTVVRKADKKERLRRTVEKLDYYKDIIGEERIGQRGV